MAQGSQGPLSKKEELSYRLSQGRPHLFVDMQIVNDEGSVLPQDGKATGELQVRGPHVLKSYFRVSKIVLSPVKRPFASVDMQMLSKKVCCKPAES